MANRAVIKRHVDPEIFKAFLKSRNVSIRQLGIYCETNERTIRRALRDEQITLVVGLDLCSFFDCTFDDIFGPDNSPEWARDKKKIFEKVK